MRRIKRHEELKVGECYLMIEKRGGGAGVGKLLSIILEKTDIEITDVCYRIELNGKLASKIKLQETKEAWFSYFASWDFHELNKKEKGEWEAKRLLFEI